MTDQMPGQISVATPTQVVERFLFALQDKDFDLVQDLLDDNILYENVSVSRIRGRGKVVKLLRGLGGPHMGFEVKIHRSAVDGTSVLNERTDAVRFGRFRMQFWVCGVFEVREGRITLWRDYFDFYDMTKAALRGLFAMVVPALRQSL